MNFKDELNEEQYAAVTAADGPALVIAAAGTGKTRTLIYRLAFLVSEKKVSPDEVLLLTFTNKAAKEMLTRAEELVQRSFTNGYSGTFHSFANRLLRNHADWIGFGKDYTILDSDDSKKLVRNCISEMEVDKKSFPKPDVLLSLFGVISGQMGDLEAAIQERFELSSVEPELVIELHARYQKRKRDSNAMDFDDLLIYALQLLEEHENIRSRYQKIFQYVLVDEYQDTNAIQAALVHLLVQEHGNLMVVGDDFQSIYSWRGADFRNFLDFEQFYRGAQQYKLQTNYRSSPEILDVANEVIAGNPEQFQKELKAFRPAGSKPALAILRDGLDQAYYIINQAKKLHEQRGIALSDICILYRSHFHAMELQMQLARVKMPYILTSGVRFFEQAHIKDVLSVLQLLTNPSNELSFSRLLELLPRVGKKGSIKMFRKLGGRANFQRLETHETLLSLLPAAAREIWREHIQPVFLAYAEENLQDDPGEIIYRFIIAFYEEYMIENFDNHKFRKEDLDGMIDFTAQFKTTEDFLSEIALLTNLDQDNDARNADNPDAIRLSTIHQSKGLEWKAVFILFLNDEMFPNKRAVDENDDTEERRLFYVAVTRAEDYLFLCAPSVRRQRDGQFIPLTPSRFLLEIPSDLLQRSY